MFDNVTCHSYLVVFIIATCDKAELSLAVIVDLMNCLLPCYWYEESYIVFFLLSDSKNSRTLNERFWKSDLLTRSLSDAVDLAKVFSFAF